MSVEMGVVLILWSGFWMILDDFLQISLQILSGFHGTFMWVVLAGVTRTWRSDSPNHGGFHRISVVSYKDQWGYTVSNKGWNSLVGCWFQFLVTTNYRLARKECPRKDFGISFRNSAVSWRVTGYHRKQHPTQVCEQITWQHPHI